MPLQTRHREPVSTRADECRPSAFVCFRLCVPVTDHMLLARVGRVAGMRSRNQRPRDAPVAAALVCGPKHKRKNNTTPIKCSMCILSIRAVFSCISLFVPALERRKQLCSYLPTVRSAPCRRALSGKREGRKGGRREGTEQEWGRGVQCMVVHVGVPLCAGFPLPCSSGPAWVGGRNCATHRPASGGHGGTMRARRSDKGTRRRSARRRDAPVTTCGWCRRHFLPALSPLLAEAEGGSRQQARQQPASMGPRIARDKAGCR
jgi:hypothetical protein